MTRICLTTLSLLLLLLAPSEADVHSLPARFPSLFPFLGRQDEVNTEITGDTAEDKKQRDKRTPFTLAQNAFHTPNKLSEGFYDQSCPDVHNIISDAFFKIFSDNPGAIGHILRLQFHDCFVNGCDASILLDFTPTGENVEKSSAFNGLLLKGAEMMDDIKTKVEEQCPETVSCADLMAFTTNVAMTLAGLSPQNPLGGRKDSLISLATMAEEHNLPLPEWNMDQVMELFGRKGFNIEEMVVLLGGHSVGIAHCDFFMQRATNFKGSGRADPTLPKDVVEEMKNACPHYGQQQYRNPPMSFDATPTVLDNLFYKEMVQRRKALLLTDSLLIEDYRTRPIVEQLAANETMFTTRFPEVMAKLTSLNVLTGTEGEVRKICRSLN